MDLVLSLVSPVSGYASDPYITVWQLAFNCPSAVSEITSKWTGTLKIKHFQNNKTAKEKAVLDFASDNTEPYNKSFLMSELKAALKKSNETAAGPDGI
ncbi:Pol-like protein [Elysia marginata]|uniref:Pol-like protein n=1 Tax=Elysia marginata TaxID=1093978 RepID=A0AAV4HA54_9GAST|nr:Pol-like protein [Elysia marginata]